MGLIKAAMGAAGSVMADQWKEYFYCESIPENVMAVKGLHRVSGRSSNYKGSENIISNGSIVAIADGQCMIIVDQGKVTELCAEPGEFVYNASTEPSIFSGELGTSILDTFKNIGKRFTYENVRFEVKDGKIIKATANDTARINALLDTDAGARYFGEFAIGVNPYVLHPMKDTLFDEKICGSFHLTPGMAYEDAFNGNKSAVHWDLVMIQRPEYGGGEIWFDDVLIRKDGLFVIDELKGLNPENLK